MGALQNMRMSSDVHSSRKRQLTFSPKTESMRFSSFEPFSHWRSKNECPMRLTYPGSGATEVSIILEISTVAIVMPSL